MNENRRVTFLDQMDDSVEEMSHVKRSIRSNNFPPKVYNSNNFITPIDDLIFEDDIDDNKQPQHQQMQPHHHHQMQIQMQPHHQQIQMQPQYHQQMQPQQIQMQPQHQQIQMQPPSYEYPYQTVYNKYIPQENFQTTSTFQPQQRELTCRDLALHIEDCPLCSKVYRNDNTIYVIIIIFLVIIIGILLKKVLDL